MSAGNSNTSFSVPCPHIPSPAQDLSLAPLHKPNQFCFAFLAQGLSTLLNMVPGNPDPTPT